MTNLSTSEVLEKYENNFYKLEKCVNKLLHFLPLQATPRELEHNKAYKEICELLTEFNPDKIKEAHAQTLLKLERAKKALIQARMFLPGEQMTRLTHEKICAALAYIEEGKE